MCIWQGYLKSWCGNFSQCKMDNLHSVAKAGNT
jgi:hypothetical protein